MAKKTFKIYGGTSANFDNVSLQIRELGYNETSKILYTGASDDGTVKGTSNINLSSSILFGESLPNKSSARLDKFYYLTKNIEESGYSEGLYYTIDGDKWIQITDPSSIIDNNVQTDSTTYSSKKIVSLLEEYQADFLGTFETKAKLDAATTDKTITPNKNDTAIVSVDETPDKTYTGKCNLYSWSEETAGSGTYSWIYRYSIANGTVVGDDDTITATTADGKVTVKFTDKTEDDANKVWRVKADGTWGLRDLSDKQDVLTAGTGILIDSTTTPGTVTISLAETTDLGSWDD
jgi:hypothetical protein